MTDPCFGSVDMKLWIGDGPRNGCGGLSAPNPRTTNAVILGLGPEIAAPQLYSKPSALRGVASLNRNIAPLLRCWRSGDSPAPYRHIPTTSLILLHTPLYSTSSFTPSHHLVVSSLLGWRLLTSSLLRPPPFHVSHTDPRLSNHFASPPIPLHPRDH